ncbi:MULTISPECIES: hypothetical protein [unclassified Streptococcus]|uniref:hypothetical protein n=1 Tax=unclassified Streptococcus TaxID=2608887 RepID=UPI0018AB615A|nr:MULTISPECIES: hypothetical protein [unclassified Streptococcus]MBF8971132.1 hypothetical protein [Streptococcus sp. NLN76]MBG9367972.1 hypothetical protein [Streptococcus sp. NLN64]
MKKTLLVSSLLLAPALIYAQEVQAEENIVNPRSSFTDYTSAIQVAKDEGVILAHDQPITVSTIGAISQVYNQ